MANLSIFLLLILSISTVSFTNATNITEVLSHYPEYSTFNQYLTDTRIADEINTRSTITVLILTNGALAPLAKYPLSVVKTALMLHILLDYYDAKKLHDIPDGSTESTTLYQTTGIPKDKSGFLNITDLKGGKVGFGSALPGAPIDSTYTKSVKQVPYNFSVIEISQPIMVKEILTAPSAAVNLTALIEKAGSKTFASLVMSTGVIKVYETALSKGLTVFAPNDEAFKADGLPDFDKLLNAELVSLLQYHALPSYYPIGALKSSKDSISTLATNGVGKYDVSVKRDGDSVSLVTGLGTSRIASTVVDSPPFVVFTVDSVLLPVELFGHAPAPAPAGDVPAPAPESEAPSPDAEAPASVESPPAPPMAAPGGSPADAPADDSEDSTAPKTTKSSGVRDSISVVGLVTVMVSAVVSVILV